eukprot:scaffold291672_cov21-Prasinocladus_malaysianus.AAC.1
MSGSFVSNICVILKPMLCAGPYKPCQTAVGAYMQHVQRAIDEQYCMPPCQPLDAPRKVILYQNSSVSAVNPSNYVIDGAEILHYHL